MKIYSQVFDLSRPSPHRFWVAPFSDFKFGIKLVNAGAEVENTFTVTAGTTTLTPDEDKIDGFTIYTTKSTDTGFVEYTITVNGIQQRFKLIQIITDSTVFEVGGGGGDVPEDVATKTWVNSQISDFVEQDDLTGYATKAELTDYVETSDLTAYYTKSETSSATEISTALEGKQPAGNYLTAETDPTFNTWLSGEEFGIGYGTQVNTRGIAIGYATKALGMYSVAIGAPNCNALETGAIQLGDGINMTPNTFQVYSYPMLSSDGKIPNERLHLSAVSEADWSTLSGNADAGTFYFVY